MPGPMGGAHGHASAKPKNVGKTFARLLQYLKNYRWQVVVIVIGLLVSAGAGVAGTYLLKPIINQISEMVKTQSTDLTTFLTYLVILALVYGFGAITSYVVNRMIVNVATGALE
ncbi:MAG: hypothetical protein ABFD03_11845, partial [Clostridiaceae bacterium]